MKKVTISLYSFDELNEAAQEKAINENIEFLDRINFDDTLDEIEQSAVQHSKKDAIEHIQINEYLFFSDGEQAHVTAYVGKHPKAGIVELHFHGQVFNITNA